MTKPKRVAEAKTPWTGELRRDGSRSSPWTPNGLLQLALFHLPDYCAKWEDPRRIPSWT